MKNLIILLVLTVASVYVSSCGKPVDVEGTVYSKHLVPIPNVEVYLEIYKGSDYSERSVGRSKTNTDGKYKISNRFRNQRGYKVFCVCDSGSARSSYLTRSSRQDVDLVLN